MEMGEETTMEIEAETEPLDPSNWGKVVELIQTSF